MIPNPLTPPAAALVCAAVLEPELEKILAATAAACPQLNSLPPPSPEEPAPQQPGEPVAPSYDPGSSDLGDYGAAVLPSLEAARHAAFMQFIGPPYR